MVWVRNGCASDEVGRASIADNAEPVAERIAAEGDGRTLFDFEFLLALRAGVQRRGEDAFEIVDMEVDVNPRPVALVAANVIGAPAWFRRLSRSSRSWRRLA